MWNNRYDKWQQEIDSLINDETEIVEDNLNKILKIENKGKLIFYPYRCGNTHSGLKRDVDIVLDLLEEYKRLITPWEYNMSAFKEPSRDDLASLRSVRTKFFFETLDNLEFYIDLFEDIQKIAENDSLTKKRKQRLIHLTLHSNGKGVQSFELQNRDEHETKYAYNTNLFRFSGLRHLKSIRKNLRRKSRRFESVKELPSRAE